MRIERWIVLLLVACSCRHSSSDRTFSFIHRMLDTVEIDHSRNVLIYSINPNDCISCLNGFKLFDESLRADSGACVYVISVRRAVEKKELLEKLSYPDLHPARNKAVLWGDILIDSINSCSGHDLPLTLVTVYNYDKDSILFSSPVRELEDIEVLRRALKKE
jgi:hypothetical protein